jgi:hypothetical protein
MKLFEILFAAALVIPANDAGAPRPELTTQRASANDCVEIQETRFYNSCNYGITIAWCIEGGSDAGYTCNGRYRGYETIGAYATYPHFSEGNNIKYCETKGALRDGRRFGVGSELTIGFGVWPETSDGPFGRLAESRP